MSNEQEGMDVSDMTLDELKDALLEQNEKANFLIDQFQESAQKTKDLFIENLKTMYVMIMMQHRSGDTSNTVKYNKSLESLMEMMSNLIIIED
tara:strand:+ start:559 stop:837 length:279 start_codon:yes stop_codon:yes gene_type:complete